MVSAEHLGRHVLRMRTMTVAFLGVTVAATAVGFGLEHRDPGAATPLSLTLVAYAATLWLGFTANRDAASRMATIRRAFAAHGEVARLLRDHLTVYLVIMLRLSGIVGCGMVVTVWGTGAAAAIPLHALAAILMVMTWPTEDKSRLLLRRAAAERDQVAAATRER